jgi:small-conductance mechanosensitive channel
MYIASDKTIRLGDYIELDEERRGYVEKMTWRTIWIKTLTNNMVIIPNSKLADSTIINYNQPKAPMLIKVPVGVSYHSDLEKVEEVSLRVAKRIMKKTHGANVGEDPLRKYGIESQEPFIRYTSFGDSNINFNVLFLIKDWVKQYEVKDEFIKALKKEFDKENIEISFPCRNIYERSI